MVVGLLVIGGFIYQNVSEDNGTTNAALGTAIGINAPIVAVATVFKVTTGLGALGADKLANSEGTIVKAAEEMNAAIEASGGALAYSEDVSSSFIDAITPDPAKAKDKAESMNS